MTEYNPETYKLYSPVQVTLATFLGGPLAGSILLASNARRIESSISARSFLAYGILGTAAVFGIAYVLPEWIPSYALPIGYTIGIRQATIELQGAAIESHVFAGGKNHSYWRVLGIGIGCLLGLLVIIFSLALALSV